MLRRMIGGMAKRDPEKQREYNRRYRARNLEKDRERCRKWQREHPGWQQEWNANNKEKVRDARRRFATRNPERAAAMSKKWRESEVGSQRLEKWYKTHLSIPENRMRRIAVAARYRARQRGMPFDDELLTLLPLAPASQCACCGITLDYEMKKRSRMSRGPSIDRIDSSGGYTVGNIAIICVRCNMVKMDSSPDELRTVLAYIERAGRYGTPTP